MRTMFKLVSTISTALGCVLAVSGPAHAGADGSPGAQSGRAPVTMNHAGRGNGSPRPEFPSGQWRGQSHAEWAQAWWRWWMSIPLKVNSTSDVTGANCGLNQDGPVWFLAGPLGGNFTPTCVIPYGKAIVTPIVAFINDYPCPADFNFEPAPGQALEDYLTEGVTPFIDSFTLIFAALDGKAMKARRVTTKAFGFTGAADVKALDPCVTGSPQVGVSDGYFITIDPLPRGDHVLQINSSSPGFATSGTFTLRIR